MSVSVLLRCVWSVRMSVVRFEILVSGFWCVNGEGGVFRGFVDLMWMLWGLL